MPLRMSAPPGPPSMSDKSNILPFKRRPPRRKVAAALPVDTVKLSREFVDDVVTTLRRDVRWRDVPRFELELLLGDVERELEEVLSGLVVDLMLIVEE